MYRYWAEKICCVNKNVVIDYVSLLGRENMLYKRERCDRFWSKNIVVAKKIVTAYFSYCLC